MSFALAPPLMVALLTGAALPLLLYSMSRVPALSGREATQFFYAVLASFVVFAVAASVFPILRPDSVSDAILIAMTLAGAGLVYLQAWGFMTRGYTLGLLLTLLTAGKPLTAEEIAQNYRGGDGLEWIVQHRLHTMIEAGLVRREGDRLVLTEGRGKAVAMLQRLCIAILGLRRTG